jgi:hypothetical protein
MKMSENPAGRLLLQKKPAFRSYNIRHAEGATLNGAVKTGRASFRIFSRLRLRLCRGVQPIDETFKAFGDFSMRVVAEVFAGF